MLSRQEIQKFQNSLLRWYSVHQRDLPWRRTRDPYAIWISEIMLQQTRVAAVIPYYERFLQKFPDFRALAAAPEQELLAYWAGLGYYYRARHMQKAAQKIAGKGAFPNSYDEIRSLPGIGEYTAAAVASIGFNLPHAVVDGNVYRVLSRIFNDSTNIASSRARKHFASLAETVLDRRQPGTYNQALMELGATVCLPKKPQCLLCPVASVCRARAQGTQDTLPVKIKPQKSVGEERTLFLVEQGDSILLWQRPADSRLMPGFWELPERAHLPEAVPCRLVGSFRHGITFHDYRFELREATVDGDVGDCRWVAKTELPCLPLSTIVRKAFGVLKRGTAVSAHASGV
ncbi:MAG: A/G-specific adenine glycosylase [Acidobacteriaceae bacterium]|nr:A/G-specific adenine glycosylase [Acidobacteriaceae bacterium]